MLLFNSPINGKDLNVLRAITHFLKWGAPIIRRARNYIVGGIYVGKLCHLEAGFSSVWFVVTFLLCDPGHVA